MASDGNNVEAFVRVTQATRGEAEHYLEASQNDLNAAVSLYYAESTSGTGVPGVPAPLTTASSSAADERRPSTGSVRRSSHNSSSSSLWSRGGSAPNRVATLADLLKQEETGADNEGDDDDDDPARLFTGGEKSGLAVQNPDSARGGRPGHRNIVDAILDQARRGPPPEESDEAEHGSEVSSGSLPQFRGRGFRLGSGEDDSVPDSGPVSVASGLPGILPEPENERVRRTLTFWRDGFSIDEGPLYRFDDPQNVQYLEAINRGRAPLQLMNVRPNQAVDVRINQRPDEDYVAPKKPINFSTAGEGQRLGGPGLATSKSPEPAAVLSPTQNHSITPPQDGDAPVQLRLADGSVHRCRFVSAGPIQQLYDFADSLSAGRPYTLQTPFPVRLLSDRSETVAAAGLSGSVVIQRWA